MRTSLGTSVTGCPRGDSTVTSQIHSRSPTGCKRGRVNEQGQDVELFIHELSYRSQSHAAAVNITEGGKP